MQQIFEVTSEMQPPVYYFYDRDRRQLTHLFNQRPEIKPQEMAQTKRVTYAARDGLKIPAYLTLPVGREPRNLPAIALVHGGPWARDMIQWDPEVQLLANRGFAVLQMNFRGSSGFGDAYLRAGYREWGQKIQDDITDGVKWLIAEGIADRDRIGITGGSYGGYATLVGLVKTPELYRAGAAYASVTDIEFLISDDKWYDWGVAWHETMVGGGRNDVARLRQSSPLRRAAEIRVPVLLGHGENDQRVHVRQSRRMADAMKEAGKQVEYMEFPDEVHGFLLETNRVRWYERLAAFFEEHLAPRVTAQAAAAG
jgi:dipeptidyl aminopeptidase/acylaminoacyl peptidase